MEDVHVRSYGPSMIGRVLIEKIMRLGYFQSTMDLIVLNLFLFMYRLMSYTISLHLAFFVVQGIDIIEKVTPTASNEHKFIIVAIDCFSKQIEVQCYKTVGTKQISNLVRKNIIDWLGCLMRQSLIMVHSSRVKFKIQLRNTIFSTMSPLPVGHKLIWQLKQLIRASRPF